MLRQRLEDDATPTSAAAIFTEGRDFE